MWQNIQATPCRTSPYLGLGRTGNKVKGFVGPRKKNASMLKSKTFRVGIHTKYLQIKQKKKITFFWEEKEGKSRYIDQMSVLQIHEEITFVFSYPSLLKLEVLQPGD